MLLEDYRTLNWSRLQAVHEFGIEEVTMYPLGPDIVEECQAVAQLSRDSVANWAPLFEPGMFNEAHGPLTVADYGLSQDGLRVWAERTIKIRAVINSKALSVAESEDQNTEVNATSR